MSQSDFSIVKEVVQKAKSQSWGDYGSCVMGMKLKFDGVEVMGQVAQGASSCSSAFEYVIEESGFDESRFSVRYGVMD